MRRWVGYRRAAVLPEIGRLGFAVGAFSEEEVSIWTALQLYVDHLERRAILAAEEFDSPEIWAALHPSVDHPNSEAYLEPLGSREAWELEEYLKDLGAAMRGASSMDPAQVYAVARRVLEIVFASDDTGHYSTPRDFWEGGVPEGRAHGAGAPLQPSQALTPLASMLPAVLGEHVSLAEAAHGLAPRALEARRAEGRLRAIRVEGELRGPHGELGSA